MGTNHPNRRMALKGMLGGAAVTVGLPLLDLFLDGNGRALAATGAPIPTRFGTWFWGCRVNAARWVPDTLGANYDIKAELQPIAFTTGEAISSKVATGPPGWPKWFARMISPPGLSTRANWSRAFSGSGTSVMMNCAVTASNMPSGKVRWVTSMT